MKMTFDSIFRILRHLVPKRILGLSPAYGKTVTTRHSELMKKPHRDVSRTGCEGACPGIFINLFTLGLVCLAIGIGGCDPDKDPPRKANHPFPAEDFLHSTITPHLQWENGDGADTYDIYLGTDEDLVANADSHDPSFMGNQSQLSYLPSTKLFYNQDYYWRIDSINEHGKTKGDVWHFRTYNENTVDAQHEQIHSIETIIRDARNPKWSPDGKKISFMRLHGETAGTGFYEIYTVNVDGTDELCITEICPDLPQGRHKGTVSWHPSSQWLLLVVEKEAYFGSDQPGPRSLAVGGIGINTDMWLMDADGSQAWRLTNVPTKMSETDPTPYSGILHPQFNHQDDCTMDIGVLDLTSGDYENLTDSWQQEGFAWDGQSAWDEHAYLSNDGNLLAYMSSNGFPMKLSSDTERLNWRSDWLISELWWMDPALKAPFQATYFNDPTAPEFIGENKNIIGLVPNWNLETTAFVLQCGVRHLDPVTEKIIDITYELKIVWLDLNQNGLRDADENQCGNGICEADETAGSCPRDCLIDTISIIQKHAAHGSFAPDNFQIVVDRPNPDHFYDLYVKTTDKSA
jgi:hypothetical protein